MRAVSDGEADAARISTTRRANVNAVEALTVALLRERGEDGDLHPRVVQSLDAENSGLRSARMVTIAWRCGFAGILRRQAERDVELEVALRQIVR